MKKADIEKKTEELVMPIIERFGYELWDVEYGERIPSGSIPETPA